MLNQHGYGKMDVDPVPREGGVIRAICDKCKVSFLLEKNHKEVHINGMFFRRKPDKNLVPTRPTDNVFHRLCLSCYDKFNEWIGA